MSIIFDILSIKITRLFFIRQIFNSILLIVFEFFLYNFDLYQSCIKIFDRDNFLRVIIDVKYNQFCKKNLNIYNNIFEREKYRHSKNIREKIM